EYERFVDATRHEPPRDWSHPPFARPDLPVVGVSWIDAAAYCAWRSEQDGRPVRLPTEAEWEFAARGRQQALFPWGNTMPEWIPNGGRGPLEAPWPVTLGEPTDFGLLGIAANVHEWCADWHDKDYYSRSPERNPGAPTRACDAPHAAERGATRTPCAASHCAASSIRPSVTTTLGSASREAAVDSRIRANACRSMLATSSHATSSYHAAVNASVRVTRHVPDTHGCGRLQLSTNARVH